MRRMIAAAAQPGSAKYIGSRLAHSRADPSSSGSGRCPLTAFNKCSIRGWHNHLTSARAKRVRSSPGSAKIFGIRLEVFRFSYIIRRPARPGTTPLPSSSGSGRCPLTAFNKSSIRGWRSHPTNGLAKRARSSPGSAERNRRTWLEHFELSRIMAAPSKRTVNTLLPSSSGSGRCPLTAVTGVRIP